MKTSYAALALLLSSTLATSAAAVTVFHSPANDGGEGATVPIPDTDTPVAINIWVRPTPGSPVSAGPARCSGDPNSPGDDVCMWDVHVKGTDQVVFDSFVGAAGVVGHIDNTGPDPILRVNGGEAVDPNVPAEEEAVGVLTVRVGAGGVGEVQVIGNQWVNTQLAVVSVSGTPGGQPLGAVGAAAPDADGDGVPDAGDNCPFVINTDQTASTQAGFESVGCACLCGDVNLDCGINSGDALEIQLSVGFAPPQVAFDEAHCDVNGDGTCNSGDALEIKLFAGFAAPQLAFSPTNCAFNQALP